MPYFTTNDRAVVRYLDWGDGPPLVFASSWALGGEMWEHQMVPLAEAGRRCVMYDRRGSGRSDVPRSGYDLDTLADDKVVRLHRRTDLDEALGIDAELDDLALRLDLRLGEVAAVGLGKAVGLDGAGAELQRDVAVLILGPLAHHLAVLQPEHRHREVGTVLGEDAGHAQLLCDQTGTHRILPFLFGG